jgi:hypothetical protein
MREMIDMRGSVLSENHSLKNQLKYCIAVYGSPPSGVKRDTPIKGDL